MCWVWFVCFVLLQSTGNAQTLPQLPRLECVNPLLQLHAGATTIQWINCSSTTYIYNSETKQNYLYDFIDLTEERPDGSVAFSAANTFSLEGVDRSTETFYNINTTDLYENGEAVGKSISFTITGGLFGIIFSLYNKTMEIQYGDHVVLLEKGSLKIDTTLAPYPFQDANNFVSVFYEIRSNKNMVGCNLTQLEGPFVQAFCEGVESDFKAEYPTYALVNGDIHPISFEIVSQTGINGRIFSEDMYSLLYSSTEEEGDDCDESQVRGFVEKATFKVKIPYFQGNFFFDPEVSVLLGGAERRNNNGCSSEAYDILRDPIYWLSVSFIVVALAIVVIIVAIGSTTWGRKRITGRTSIETALKRCTRITQAMLEEDTPPL